MKISETVTIKAKGIVSGVRLKGLGESSIVPFEPILFYSGDKLVVTVDLERIDGMDSKGLI